jgi:hypothetical protein
MRIEARQLFRSNGLIDDLVLYAKPNGYLQFAEFVGKAINSGKPTLMTTESNISFEITCDEEEEELFTSLQNKTNDYFSMDDWKNRNILRVYGTRSTLESLQKFLVNLAAIGEGYSNISEYSENGVYSTESPEWRLHVEIT